MADRVAASHAEQQFGNSAAARTINYGGALTPSSLLIVKVTTFNTGITVTVSDSVNGAYTQAGSYAVNGLSRASIWYFENNASNGTPTVTITPSASAYISVSIDEWTGMLTSGALRNAVTATFSGSALTIGPVTATAGDIIEAVVSCPTTGVTTSTVTAPYTLVTNLAASATLQGIFTDYHKIATGNESTTFNLSSVAGSSAGVMASFIPAAVTSIQAGLVTDQMPPRPPTRVVAY